MSDEVYRCPSIGAMPVGHVLDFPRCVLPEGHEDGHEGVWRGRGVLWDYSPLSVGDDSSDRWVPA